VLFDPGDAVCRRFLEAGSFLGQCVNKIPQKENKRRVFVEKRGKQPKKCWSLLDRPSKSVSAPVRGEGHEPELFQAWSEPSRNALHGCAHFRRMPADSYLGMSRRHHSSSIRDQRNHVASSYRKFTVKTRYLDEAPSCDTASTEKA
jgi:hypothetical protein